MNIFTTTRTVEGRYITKVDPEYGYPYLEDHVQLNVLVFRIKLFGISIWKKDLDKEEVPWHVIADNAVGGHLGNWRSKFRDMPDVVFYRVNRWK